MYAFACLKKKFFKKLRNILQIQKIVLSLYSESKNKRFLLKFNN